MTQIDDMLSEESQDFPRLDRHGNHLQLYGPDVPHDPTSTIHRLGVPASLKVASRREKTLHGGRPQVALFSHDGPWILDFRLTPDAARALAVSLVDAAEACDALGRRLSCKTRKTSAA